MKEHLKLYWAFLKIGGLTFGGGLTMLPMLKYELVEKRNWITEEKLLDCYAIGQCTPGIIAVNTATFVGYLRKGVAGGISATMGMVTPSVLIITLVALFMETFIKEREEVKRKEKRLWYCSLDSCGCVLCVNWCSHFIIYRWQENT